MRLFHTVRLLIFEKFLSCAFISYCAFIRYTKVAPLVGPAHSRLDNLIRIFLTGKKMDKSRHEICEVFTNVKFVLIQVFCKSTNGSEIQVFEKIICYVFLESFQTNSY